MEIQINYFKKKFKNKKILITGHTGFKGAWLCQIFLMFGSKIMGVSNSKVSKINLFDILRIKDKIQHVNYDLTKKTDKYVKKIIDFNPDFIFHLAAQSLVIESYKNPSHTLENNIISSLNILEISKKIKNLKSLIYVTSDKCYDVNNNKISFSEDDPLGGKDPYSISKACSEHIFQYYFKALLNANKVGAASVRSGNVIGGGDWSKYRLIPDIIRAIKNKKIILRDPNNIRPWQHVLDCLFGYIFLSIKLSENPKLYSGSWNFGPGKKYITASNVALKIIKYLNLDKKIKIIKLKKNNFIETKMLNLNVTKSLKYLGFKNILDINKSLMLTALWYKEYLDKKIYINSFTNLQILNYINNFSIRNNK